MILQCLTQTFFHSEIQGSGVQADPIVGGVLGILLFLTLILVVSVVVVVLTMRHLNLQGKENIQGIVIDNR